MTTPTFWRRPCFGVAETADMIGSTEAALRAWITRCPLDEFAGEKTQGRLWLTGRDGYFYSLVQVMSHFGVPVRTAMYSAASIAEYGPPTYDYLTITVAGGETTFQSSDSKDVNGAAILLPLRDLYEQHLKICRERHAQEAA